MFELQTVIVRRRQIAIEKRLVTNLKLAIANFVDMDLEISVAFLHFAHPRQLENLFSEGLETRRSINVEVCGPGVDL